ncbi:MULTISPECIES: transcriptional repressor AgaR [unclassified Gilliamella]|uniref:transcriptional repressor AgaR n=1 Tax=unclassified Gilliamella TaxID=2685620 RepID=UPI00132171E2|nr:MULTISPECIES: transcriptional repressor AgaR [unclassified Gilliamella]MWN32045.1 DeoR family transcriptional regulator [Gilliamella sp. Pra-s60]MWP29304.1 DeoR family transcriptional regulator [Gilliamella sp. Pra-s54]
MNEEIINTLQRREKIIDLLENENTVSVNKLSKLFNVSTVTIRNDLRYLEKKGCALRSYGGAMINKAFALDKPLLDKSRINSDIKHKIAQKAADMVNDGDRIILDSGSTTAAMVPYLINKQNLIVLTNALNIAYDLSTNTDIQVIIAGGNVRKNSYSISGENVEQQLKMYHFNKLFLGVDGFDLNVGITTPNFAEAAINKVMCQVSDHIIAITDSSKFGRKSFCTIEKINHIKTIITDSNIPKDYLTQLQTLGIDVVISDI